MQHALWECTAVKDLLAKSGSLVCLCLPVGETHPLVYQLALLGVGWVAQLLSIKDYTVLCLTLNSVKATICASCNLLVGKHVTVLLHALGKMIAATLQREPGDHVGTTTPNVIWRSVWQKGRGSPLSPKNVEY